jgi:hypothetical protein
MGKVKERNTLWIAGIMVLSAIVVCCAWKIYYTTVDDVFYRNIIVGKYTGTIRPNGTMIKYPLALILALSSVLFSSVDVYGIFLEVSHFLCFFLIAWYMMRKLPAKHKSALCMMCMVFWVIEIPNIVYVHFTNTAAVYAAAGVVVLLLEGNGIKAHVASICMFVMSVCVRSETFTMVLPFILLVWLLRLWDEYKRDKNIGKALRQCVIYLLVLCIFCSGIITIDYLAGDHDKSHDEYRKHRANVRDYDGVPDYDTYPEFYQSFGENGLSRAEYTLITKQMVIFDYSTDIHDIFKYMHGLNLENRARLETKYKLIAAKQKFLTVWERVMVKPQIVIAGLTWGIVGIWLLAEKRKMYLFFALAGGLGIIGEACILLYRGRMPERVMQSLMLTVVLFLFGILVRALSGDTGDKSERRQGVGRICYVTLAIFYIAVFFIMLLPGIYSKQAEYEKRYVTNTIVDEYCAQHPENVYFTIGSIGDTDRLGSKYSNRFVNYISPVLNLGSSYYELLETAGIDGTAEEAITTQDNVYLLGKEGNTNFIALDEYFAEKYKEAYSCEIVDTLENSFCVWKVQVR